MKKYLFYSLLVLLASCGSETKERTTLIEIPVQENTEDTKKIRSLLGLIEQVDGKLSEIELINAKLIGLEGEGSKSRRRVLLDQIDEIKLSIDGYIAKIDSLQNQLGISVENNGELRKLVERLKNQVSAKEVTIGELRKQLGVAQQENQRRTVENLQLTEAVEKATKETEIVKQENEAVKKENTVLNEKNTSLNNEMNLCYYAIGTKNQLKEHKIISTGFLRKTKTLPQDFDKSFFRQGDKRNLHTIDLHSKKAEIMTNQPQNSYTITSKADGTKVLTITNPAKFWEKSSFLVIKID